MELAAEIPPDDPRHNGALCAHGRYSGCWLDGEGTEWHRGTNHGVYVKFAGDGVFHFLHSGDEWSSRAEVLITAWEALEALKR